MSPYKIKLIIVVNCLSLLSEKLLLRSHVAFFTKTAISCTREKEFIMSKESQLIKAVISGDLMQVKKLVIENINIDSTNNDEMTPLMIACFNNHFEIAQELIQAHAKLDLKDVADWSALQYAMFAGNADIAILLIQSGANYEEIENKEEFLAYNEVKDFIERIKENEFLKPFRITNVKLV